LEYLLSAETFPAEPLLDNRLINRIADGPAELQHIVNEMMARLTALDPLAVKLTKEAHRMASAMPLAEAIIMGRHLNALLMSSDRITAARDALQRPADRS
jgi:enoyl-CoA hydratase/carnithine racemase